LKKLLENVKSLIVRDIFYSKIINVCYAKPSTAQNAREWLTQVYAWERQITEVTLKLKIVIFVKLPFTRKMDVQRLIVLPVKGQYVLFVCKNGVFPIMDVRKEVGSCFHCI